MTRPVTVYGTPSISDRVLAALRRAAPDPVDTAQIREQFGAPGVAALRRLRALGAVERAVGCRWRLVP